MKVKLCDVNAEAESKLPPKTEDKSGIGVHYIDAYIKPMNIKLEDGTPVRCKRRGLKITLSAGTKKGEGLMRRLDVEPRPRGDAAGRAPGSGQGRRCRAHGGRRRDFSGPLRPAVRLLGPRPRIFVLRRCRKTNPPQMGRSLRIQSSVQLFAPPIRLCKSALVRAVC